MKSDKFARNEHLVYLIAWIVIFTIPWLTNLYASGTIEWRRVLIGSAHLLPFLVIFVINDLVLMPRLFLNGHRIAYSLAVITILIVIWFGINPSPHPHYGHGNIPKPPVEMFHVTNVVMATCAVFANIAIRMYFISLRKDMEMLQIRNEQMHSELESLKYQINPHFMMNTLNNIQSLIEIDPVKACDTILKLSRMMQYVLYENNEEMVPLNREIKFMYNFIELMRIRYPENVVISVNAPDDGSYHAYVPPMLFMTFIENAFKHGISYKGRTFVR